MQCLSMICEDGVCCDRVCDGPDEICDLPGREGTCLSLQTAPAPALSGMAKVLALGVLLLIAASQLLLFRKR
jgi:hypothetical protein